MKKNGGYLYPVYPAFRMYANGDGCDRVAKCLYPAIHRPHLEKNTNVNIRLTFSHSSDDVEDINDEENFTQP